MVAQRSAEQVGLSSKRILDAATAVIEAEGSTALSMRTLAARLGVSPMAVYRWYDNKDALLDAVVERALADLTLEVPSEGTWGDRAYATAASLRRQLLERRSLLAVPDASTRLTTAVLRFADRGLVLARELGRDDASTAMVFRSLVWHTFSFVLVVDGWAEGGASEAFRAVAASIDPAQAPVFTSMADHFAHFDADALFEMSTRALVHGLAAR